MEGGQEEQNTEIGNGQPTSLMHRLALQHSKGCAFDHLHLCDPPPPAPFGAKPYHSTQLFDFSRGSTPARPTHMIAMLPLHSKPIPKCCRVLPLPPPLPRRFHK